MRAERAIIASPTTPFDALRLLRAGLKTQRSSPRSFAAQRTLTQDDNKFLTDFFRNLGQGHRRGDFFPEILGAG